MAPRSLFLRTLAVGAGAAWLGATVVQAAPATDEREAGVASAVNPDTRGTPPVTPTRVLQVGANVFVRERIETSAGGQAQMLFLDGSTLTIAPETSLTLDEFVYDPSARAGKLAATMTKGLLRFVGGKVSKDGSAAIQTLSAQIAVRGGIALIEADEAGHSTATLLFGQELKVTTPAGEQRITRPGYSVTTAVGQPPSTPVKASAAKISQSITRLAGRAGATGGAHEAPTTTRVAGATGAVATAVAKAPPQPVAAVKPAPPAPTTTAKSAQAAVTQAGQKAAATPPVLPFAVAAYQVAPSSGTTIPFLSAQGGGALPGATVSPLFLAKPTGDIGVQTGNNQTTTLQASLAIVGTGSAQRSAIEVAVGQVPESRKLQDGALAGNLRGTSEVTPGTAQLSFGSLASAAGTGATPAFSRRALPTQFTLDDATFDAAGKRSAAPATLVEFGAATPSTKYGYARTVTRTTAPADLGTARTTETIAGYADGVLLERRQAGGATESGIVASGNDPQGVTLTHVAASNRMSATLNVAKTATLAETTAGGTGGAGTASLRFGSLADPDVGRSSFIDDRRFGASEGYTQASATAAAVPRSTVDGKPVDQAALYLVSAGVVPLSSAMAGAAAECVCAYVRWGWWGGGATTSKDGVVSDALIHLGTWVAGPLTGTADMPQIGTAHYSGHAVGTVVNGAARYIAQGGFTQDVDFAKRTGSVTISNFDGNTYRGTIAGGRDFQGPLANVPATVKGRPTITGTVAGSFYGIGPAAAAEVGGQFRVGNGKVGAATYAATGVVLGRR